MNTVQQIRLMPAQNIQEIKKLYCSGMTCKEVSKIIGCSLSGIRHLLYRVGCIRTPKEAQLIAVEKKRYGSGMRGKKYSISNKIKEKMSIAAKKRWRDSACGFTLKPNGYYEATIGVNTGKKLHRVIMEAIIDRKLRKDEVVHHKDFNSKNNDPRNLVIMKNRDHSRLHAKLNNSKRKRDVNGKYI